MHIPKVLRIPCNPALAGQAELLPDIVYSRANGQALTLLTPWRAPDAPPVSHPLMVFVQGSAWQQPNLGYEIPQLSMLARQGYVVATVSHRNCMNGHPFPAFLQDVKTAIRFLRAHADEYGIDSQRVGIWGTSSGGNTALLVALTGDDPRYKTDEYADQSDAVRLAVDCFGPTDLHTLMRGAESDEEFSPIGHALIGRNDPKTVFSEMSPINHVRKGAVYPPFLLLHGDADELVPYEQSEVMLHRLCEYGADARLVCVEGAPHEGSFWSDEIYRIIFDFIHLHI